MSRNIGRGRYVWGTYPQAPLSAAAIQSLVGIAPFFAETAGPLTTASQTFVSMLTEDGGTPLGFDVPGAAGTRALLVWLAGSCTIDSSDGQDTVLVAAQTQSGSGVIAQAKAAACTPPGVLMPEALSWLALYTVPPVEDFHVRFVWRSVTGVVARIDGSLVDQPTTLSVCGIVFPFLL